MNQALYAHMNNKRKMKKKKKASSNNKAQFQTVNTNKQSEIRFLA
jgi:hypothetical protein